MESFSRKTKLIPQFECEEDPDFSIWNRKSYEEKSTMSNLYAPTRLIIVRRFACALPYTFDLNELLNKTTHLFSTLCLNKYLKAFDFRINYGVCQSLGYVIRSLYQNLTI